jgi:peptidyl-prolyl cis-trans isomerase C
MLKAVNQSNQTPVLEVNGEPIYAQEIRARVSLLRAQKEEDARRELTPEERFRLRPEAIQDLVDRTIMRQEAIRLKLTPTEAEIDATLAELAPKYDGTEGCRADAANEESREDIRSRLLVDRLLARWFEGIRQPKSTETREFYTRNQAEFAAPEMIAASHIVRQPKEGETPDDDACVALLEKVREEILAGADFAEVAGRVSDCPERGGDLAYFPRGVMIEEFEEIAFAIPVGEISKPFRTQFGWHIVKVRDRRAEGLQPFEQVAEEIAQRIYRDKQEREVATKLLALRNRARIVELAAV